MYFNPRSRFDFLSLIPFGSNALNFSTTLRISAQKTKKSAGLPKTPCLVGGFNPSEKYSSKWESSL